MSRQATPFSPTSNPTVQNESASVPTNLVRNDNSSKLLPNLPSISDNEEFLYNSFYADNNPISTSRNNEPYVGKKENLDLLQQEFQSNNAFLRQIWQLKAVCSSFRRIKKDGCCFYRAFLFGLFEYFVNNKEKIPSFIEKINSLRNSIEEVGYSMNTVDDFYQEFIETLEKFSEPQSDVSTLEDVCNCTSTANYLVVFARLLTATYIKKNKSHFENFIESDNVDEFCRTDVDPMWVEAEQMQVIALCSILEMPISIYCLDSSTTNFSVQVFPNSQDTPLLFFLYRPGHYELLYRQEQELI